MVKPPEAKRGREPYLAIEIGAPVESDGTLPLRVSADALDALRDAWSGICLLHREVMGKVSPVNPEVACQIKSRKLAFDQKQRALKHADGALAELRAAMKETEAALTKKTIPPRGQGDLVGELRAQETRAWLRGLAAGDRQRLVAQAIAVDDVATVSAALERPMLAGVGPEQAAMLMASWRRQRAPEELARLEVLAQTSAKVEAAALALQRRFDEAYDHGHLDRIEATTAAA